MTSTRALPLLLLLAGCPQPRPTTPPPEPGPLNAAVATRKIDQPVGITMGGYLRSRTASDPGSPWADQFPASRGVHTEPTVRVLALSNGLTRVAMVRLDTTITSPSLRSRVLQTLAARGEAAHVLLYATHSHAAPARFMPPARLGSSTGTDFVSLVMDHYDVEVEQRLTDAIDGAIAEAFGALKPVSLGVATVEAGDFNNDRRCENDPIYGPDFRDTAMTVLRFDEVDATGAPVRPLMALMHYAMHGTVLPEENTLQSTEAPGALELYASDAVGVPVMYVQGAAGDVSPKGSPYGHTDLQNLERQGRVASRLALEAFTRAAPGAAPAKLRLDFLERGVLVGREAIGYAKGDFPEYGGIQCAAGGPGDCGAYVSKPSEVVCLPLEPRKPLRTALSLVRIGDDVVFLSLPGEPGTGLSRKIDAALAPLGAARALTVGYSQDHYGYLLEEDDWLRGGYEPTVSAWGWKFGPYLLSEVQAFVASVDQTQTPADLWPLPDGGVTARPVSDSLRAPAVTVEPLDGPRLTTHVFSFEGGDPALGLPQVSLEKSEGGAFVPVHASATRLVINGPELLVRYAATPTYKDDSMTTTRVHTWTVQFETVPTTALGDYRLVARGKAKVAGATSSYELTSRAFAVTSSGAVTAVARVTMDGRLALEPRFPPNPTLYASDISDVTGHYRVRDLDSDPKVGARANGVMGPLAVTVTAPDASMSSMMFMWSESELAFVSTPVTASGVWHLEVAAQGLTDGSGNANVAVVALSVTK